MRITISSRHTEVSPALEQAARVRIERLGRYDHGLDHAEVHFSSVHNPRIAEPEMCEVLVNGSGAPLQCKVNAADSFAAIERAAAKLESQLAKRKTRRLVRVHGS